MTLTVELIPLNCLRCDLPIPAEVEEVAWICRNCGASMTLTEAGELIPCEIFFAADLSPRQKGKPFWVAEGKVKLMRESYTAIGKSDREAEAFWSRPRLFFVPAYSCELQEMLAVGIHLLTNPPSLVRGPSTDFLPITHSAADFRPFAEFLIIALEAARKDKVKTVHFELELQPPVLWILP
ncbi:MAG: hypothetical protein RML93_09315 [Anaerolineales bacterium]|nr:hypothetical protein [Anaerolineales bacterium]MDW8447473.1 hypothetical protein [Anaerolineales bacterium]